MRCSCPRIAEDRRDSVMFSARYRIHRGAHDPRLADSGHREHGRAAALRAPPRRDQPTTSSRSTASPGCVPGQRDGPRQGEADFVLAHPEYGVLTLEVKGGAIRFDAEHGQVVEHRQAGRDQDQGSGPPGGERVAPAPRSRRAVSARRRRGNRLRLGCLLSRHTRRRRSLRADLPRELVLDHRDLAKLEQKLEALFRYWHDPAKDSR